MRTNPGSRTSRFLRGVEGPVRYDELVKPSRPDRLTPIIHLDGDFGSDYWTDEEPAVVEMFLSGEAMDEDVRRFLACHFDVTDRLNSLVPVLTEQFGDTKCRLDLAGSPGLEQIFVWIPYAGDPESAMERIANVDKIRATFPPAVRRMLQVDVEFV